jgi:hypothetical protein
MPGMGKLEMVDAEAIAKNAVEKVRQKQCRNGAEMQWRKAATQATTAECAEYAERRAAGTWECGVRSAACGMESAAC